MFWNKDVVESVQNKRNLLKFFDLTEEVESLLMERMTERSYSKGDTIVREGEPGNSIFFVASGTLMVIKNNKAGQPILISKMVAGDFFGEISLLVNKPRSATVIAADDSLLFEIEKKRSLVFLISSTPNLKNALKEACLRRIENDKRKLGADVVID
jgi:CRP-like cAMP-binding protein